MEADPDRAIRTVAIRPWIFTARSAAMKPTPPPRMRMRSWRAKAMARSSKLCYGGHVLMENRNGLVINTRVTLATGTSEREACIDMVEEIPGKGGVTLGADKGYDTKDHVAQLRERSVTPHVAQKKHSAIDARTARHAGYKVSQQ